MLSCKKRKERAQECWALSPSTEDWYYQAFLLEGSHFGTKCPVQCWWYVQGRAGDDYHTGTQKANSGGPDLVRGTPVAHLREGWIMCQSSPLPVSPSLIQLSPKQPCTLSFPDLSSWSFWHSDHSRHKTQNLRPGKDWQGGVGMWVSRGATLNFLVPGLRCSRD